ncbi:MAG: RagB/SusD family nutrient uptake outer membrane protein [Moheibacter sp.]
MKNLFKYFLSAMVVAISLQSCSDEDILQTPPGDANIDNYFNNNDEFTAAILGAYNGLKGNGMYSGAGNAESIIILGDLLSDNLISSQDGRGSNRDTHNFLYDGGSVPNYVYGTLYTVISRANLILANTHKIEDENFKALIESEALALRGIAHFELAKHFLKAPTQSADANSSIGIAYVDVFDPYAEPSRLGTVQETYARIMEDLENSVSGLPSSVQVDRLSQPALRAMIGRVALYMGDYPKAIANLTPVVNSVAPTPRADLQGYWRYQNSKGILFEIPMLASGDPQIANNYSQGTSNSSIVIEYSVDKELRDLYDDAREPERVGSFFRVFKNQNVCWKYAQAASGLSAFGRYLRVEEAILNLAEAQYLNNDATGALATLNILRNARYTTYPGDETGVAIFDAIMLERRKELACEGDRFFTLKRLQNVAGIPEVYKQGVVRAGNGHLQDGTGVPSAVLTLPPSSHKWQMPIPVGDLLLNPNMTQTPGY